MIGLRHPTSLYKAMRKGQVPQGQLIRRGRTRRVVRVWTMTEAHEACVRIAALPEPTRKLLDAGREKAHVRKRERRDIGWLARRVVMVLGAEVLADILKDLHRGPLADIPRGQAFLVRAALRSALARAGVEADACH